MTTLDLLPLPALGAVRLTITATAGASIKAISRSDLAGVAPVRLVQGTLPWPSTSGVLTVEDYEPAHGLARYTVTDSTGAVTTASLTVDLGTLPWLGVPVTPQDGFQVDKVLDLDGTVEGRAVVHEPIGSRLPIVISREATSRRGRLIVWAADYPAGLRVLRLAQLGRVIHHRQSVHAGMDMYCTLTRAQLRTADADRWAVECDYTEVGRPASPLSGALGWTFNALRDAWPTFDAAAAGYTTFADLRIDKRTP